MNIYDRKTKKIICENEYKEGALDFLYNTVTGRIILKLVAARPYFSKIRAVYMKSPASKKDIIPFIKKYNIDMTYYNENYKCFNDFFIRKRTIKNTSSQNELVAIADSKLSVYRIDENLRLNIKHSVYTLNEILKTEQDLKQFENGYCLVFRLSVSDYHRYCFIDSGRYLRRYRIRGLLHTVRPISSRYKVFVRNQREVSVLETETLGKVITVEVGALLVGCIKNRPISEFSKLDEKGYFEYGGSTIIVLIKDKIKIDGDILENSKNNIETKVVIGERIGEIIDCGS